MSASKLAIETLPSASTLPSEFLNAYAVENVERLSWDVALYKVERPDGKPLEHAERGQIKNALWRLR